MAEGPSPLKPQQPTRGVRCYRWDRWRSLVSDQSEAPRAIPFHVRQGDVLLIEVDAAPAAATPIPLDAGRVVLAYGEVTGHAHAIRSGSATLVADETGRRFLRAATDLSLTHEEHAAIDLPSGDYEVVIQREYVPAPVGGRAWRRVAD